MPALVLAVPCLALRPNKVQGGRLFEANRTCLSGRIFVTKVVCDSPDRYIPEAHVLYKVGVLTLTFDCMSIDWVGLYSA